LPSFIASPSDGNSVPVRGNLFSQQNERPFEVKTTRTFSPALPERFDLVKKYSIVLYKIHDLPYLYLRFVGLFIVHENGWNESPNTTV